MPIRLRTQSEIDAIARAGRVLDQVLTGAVAAVREGVTTAHLGEVVSQLIVHAGAEPILSGQPGKAGAFGHAACICVNEEVVHAPPRRRVIRSGDVVTIDAALRFPPGHEGWCVDAAHSVAIPGAEDARALHLVETAAACASEAVGRCVPGVRWATIAAAAREAASARGCVLARGYCGHGIGHSLHEPPEAGFGDPPEADFTLLPGMVLTIEPIALEGMGRPEFVTVDDGWTVLAADRRWSAHREMTIAVTLAGPVVLAGAGPEGIA